MSDILTSKANQSSMSTAAKKYVRAARGEWMETPPVWLMRQAGRYLPEYLAVRAQHDFIQVCRTPELACEVTLQPIRRFGFDAAILFSDILIPAIPLGCGLRFDSGHGPVIERPVRERADIAKLRDFDPRDELSDVLDAVRQIRTELPDETALIGFAGAPFTVACYLIEGRKPDPFAQTKAMMYLDQAAFRVLLDKLATMTVTYTKAMVESGADAIQLFDTWAGVLTDAEYRKVVLPVIRKVIEELRPLDVPVTYFALNAMHLTSVAETNADVIGLDWRLPIAEARIRYEGKPLQGNLDPVLLLANEQAIRSEARRILGEARGCGFIFNLGHGILPTTPIRSVEILLDEIRGEKQ